MVLRSHRRAEFRVRSPVSPMGRIFSQNQGEKIAEEFLKKKGYKILERNYLFWPCSGPKRGEIDLICKSKDTIVFVEVKSVKEKNPFFHPELKVNRFKIKKIIKSAENWLLKNNFSLSSKWQIDIVVIENFEKNPQISHFENVISDFRKI